MLLFIAAAICYGIYLFASGAFHKISLISVFLWLFVGCFIIGVIAKLIYAVSNLQRRFGGATLKTCFWCKTTIPIDAIRCPNCTKKLPG